MTSIETTREGFAGPLEATARPVQMLATSRVKRIRTVNVTAPDTAEVRNGSANGDAPRRLRINAMKKNARTTTVTAVVVQSISHHNRSIACDCGPIGFNADCRACAAFIPSDEKLHIARLRRSVYSGLNSSTGQVTRIRVLSTSISSWFQRTT